MRMCQHGFHHLCVRTCCMVLPACYCVFFFFNDPATTEIYTLSLHDALPISGWRPRSTTWSGSAWTRSPSTRSEEHTSELQSLRHLVCRLLLEKKKKEYGHH